MLTAGLSNIEGFQVDKFHNRICLRKIGHSLCRSLACPSYWTLCAGSDGQSFLYASNRLKEDGISVFSVGEGGYLTKVGYTLTGVHPRNFTLSADGRYVLVAVRDSDRVEVYSRDAKTGLLTPTNKSLTLSRPVCLVWM